jgi:hypothetical protein
MKSALLLISLSALETVDFWAWFVQSAHALWHSEMHAPGAAEFPCHLFWRGAASAESLTALK